MEQFSGSFFMILGSVFILIGFKIYRPFSKEKEEEMNKRFGLFYKLGGIGMLIWGF